MDITHSYEGLGQDYRKSREGIPGFASFIVASVSLKTLGRGRPVTIIELGVGSGQQTEFVEKELVAHGFSRYRILAFDKSYQPDTSKQPGQLNILRERVTKGELSDKVLPLNYDFDGHALPVHAESIDFCYMAHVFHHLVYKQAVMNDIFRVTVKGGRHFVLGVTIEDLVDHPLNRYFPMKYRYDATRYPTRGQLEQIFESAGFTYQAPFPLGKHFERPIDRSFLASIENTTIDSVLRMIRDDDPSGFRQGVSKVKKEVEQAEKNGNYQIYYTDIIKVFWGIK